MDNKVLNLDKLSWVLTKLGDLAKDISKRVLFWISYRSKKEADYFIPKKIF